MMDIVCGILKNKECRELFEEINNRYLCKICQKERVAFENHDKKYNNSYSNLIPGFSSREINIPIDVLIIGDSHGGGRKDTFREQKDLDYEVKEIAN